MKSKSGRTVERTVSDAEAVCANAYTSPASQYTSTRGGSGSTSQYSRTPYRANICIFFPRSVLAVLGESTSTATSGATRMALRRSMRLSRPCSKKRRPAPRRRIPKRQCRSATGTPGRRFCGRKPGAILRIAGPRSDAAESAPEPRIPHRRTACTGAHPPGLADRRSSRAAAPASRTALCLSARIAKAMPPAHRSQQRTYDRRRANSCHLLARCRCRFCLVVSDRLTRSRVALSPTASKEQWSTRGEWYVTTRSCRRLKLQASSVFGW